MHSDVFPRADLAAILRAIALTAATGNQSPAFQRGFAAALAAVATAVHVTPAELGSGRREPGFWVGTEAAHEMR